MKHKTQNSKFNNAKVLRLIPAAVVGVVAAAGCQQRMAEQPAPRPYEQNTMFRHTQSARPLEVGVVSRGQPLAHEPLANWLTDEGRSAQSASAAGAAAFDPKSMVPQEGAPVNPEHFVRELPFELTSSDLKRGQTMYLAVCAECHGAAGYGNGKVPERGFLRPPSYHTEYKKVGDKAEPVMDWSTLGEPSTALPAGYSRGFYRWGVKIPLREVPIGYITQVITWGYGGMGSHETQLPDWADRWRVAAYVRVLQQSQHAAVADLPAGVKDKIGQPAAENAVPRPAGLTDKGLQ